MTRVAEKAGPAEATTGPREQRPRGRRVVLGMVIVLAAGAVAVWRAGALNPGRPPGTGQQGPAAPAAAAVTRQDLSTTMPVTATLGYAGSYAVTGQGGGTLTWLPSPGRVIRQGQALYRVDNGSPVALLYGAVPDWRDLYDGVSGADVTQLNSDLVALGDASRADIAARGWDYYSLATAAGVQKLEERLGVSWPSGELTLGQVAFEPEALRVSQVSGALGGPASGPVLVATSDRHVVTIPLDVSEQSEVKDGDAVTVTLPGGTTTQGTITFIGTVAVTTASEQGQGPGVTTIPVGVTLTSPSAAGTLDQAPVTVNITTATVSSVLAVPVTALLAQPAGRYDVEVIGPQDTRRWVSVTPGPVFDDVNGLVQVTGNLAPGQRVVVASS